MTRVTKKKIDRDELEKITSRLEEQEEKNEKPNSNYVNNKELQQAFLEYQPAKQEWIDGGKEGNPPQLPEKIGRAIMQIAERRCYSPRYINYTPAWKEEMILDAILVCVKYVHNYDPLRFNNPFAYITQLVSNELKARLKKEHIHNYIKLKRFDEVNAMMASVDENNLSEEDIQSLNETTDLYKDRLSKIHNYEEFLNINKPRKKKSKKNKGLFEDEE